MSDIGTHKQKVDQERYNDGYAGVYRKPKTKKPGKTVYVCRDGKLTPKVDDSTVMMEAVVIKADELNANIRKYQQDIVARMGVPKRYVGRTDHTSMSAVVG